MNLDMIIHGGYVITMEGEGTGIINCGAIGIKGNKIITVGEEQDVLKKHTAHRYIDATNKVVMPGLVDAHIHTSNAIVRGGSQDIPSGDWMFRGILPLLSLATTEDLVKGSMLNIVEAVKTGTTTFGDFDVPMLDLISNHIKVGTRAVVSDMINELPQDVTVVEHGVLYPLDSTIGNIKLNNNTKLIEKYHNSSNGRIVCRYGPQAVDMCSVELLKEIKNLADKNDVDIFLHVAQSPEETIQSVMRNGKRPIPLLEELGYLNNRLLAAHMTDATTEELKLVAHSGTSMALCSNSNVIIGGILPPAQEFASFGGLVALGTDQAPGNNCNIMFNEMKVSALLHKYKNSDPTVFPAWKVLRMGTIESARALRLDDKVGSLKEGKLADIIILDLMEPTMSPVLEDPIRNLIPNIVYSARGNEVKTVIIDGEVVVENGNVLTVDETKIIMQANDAAKRISRNLKRSKWSADLPLAKWTSEDKY